MYTLIEDFEDDARSVSGDAFAAGAADVVAPEDDEEEGDLITAEIDDSDSESGDLANENELVGDALDAESWSDDPVRMYLTQMGEIPLLTRKQEIELAKRIENTRQRFRAKLLECNYVIQAAYKVLGRVHNGELPFDRTVQVSVTDRLEKDQILGRLPHNLRTLDVVLTRNRRDYHIAVSKRQTKAVLPMPPRPTTVSRRRVGSRKKLAMKPFSVCRA